MSGVELVPSDSRAGEGFASPQPGRLFRFPKDHGSHPEFRIEWWYVTGHLNSGDGARHSFQATFFRRAGGRSPKPTAGASTNFTSDELFLAHMAWLDVDSGRFRHEERLNRRGWDAAADTEQLAVRNGNWSLRDIDSNTFELHGGVQAEVAWTLTLKPQKPLVIFGTNGVSRKAAEPWAASHYLTFSRLAVTGQMRRGSSAQTVQGEAWMDHELSSSQLGQGQVGWDWASVQLHDGRELMAYRMRREDGKTDPYSTVAWISREGRVTQFAADQFTWKTEGNWKSPRSGAQYPAVVVLSTPKWEAQSVEVLRIEPLSADQELSGLGGSIPYWEGACRVLDTEGKVVGNAFLEMTGYAGLLRRALEY
jgi:predicted secreted hydrolase